jgi:two-component system, sensor histidine kinase YesM
VTNILQRLSLRHKLIITAIICLMVPTIVMLFTSNFFSQRIIRDQALTNAEQSLNTVQVQIQNVLLEMVEVSNRIQLDSDIALNIQYEDDAYAGKVVTTQLEQIAGPRQDMRVTILTKDGRYFSNYSFYDFIPTEFKKQPWFKDLDQLSGYESLFIGAQRNYIRSEQAKHPYVVVTVRVLRDYNSDPYAYIILSRHEDKIHELTDRLDEKIYLVNEDNKIISYADHTWIGKSIHAIVGNSGTRNSAIIKLNGENVFYVTKSLKYPNWKLISLAPYAKWTDKVNKLFQSSITIQAIAAIIFIFILAYLLQRFTRPVRKLGEIARQVEAGDLSVRSEISGMDEVGKLGQSFDNMLDRITRMLEIVKIEQELKRQAELAMLQVQIQPHFLFNVLNSIRMKLLLKGDKDNGELIGSLSAFLRGTLVTQQEFVSLNAEVEITKKYMDLMTFTMKHKVNTIIFEDANVGMEMVPRFILQPVIENAYKHGFTRKDGTIEIRTSASDGNLCIDIQDDGVGMNAELLEQLRNQLVLNKKQLIRESQLNETTFTGIGLANVYNRLVLIYGDTFRMTIDSVEQQGTRIQFIIPITQIEGDARV